MAYLETSFRANDGSGPMAHYVNVSEPVGNGLANRRDDVALVQVFLQALSNLPESPVHPRRFPIDGIWRPELRRGLVLFQKLARRALRRRGAGEWIEADGMVLPANSIYAEGGELRMYTIVALNKAYAHYYWPNYLQHWPLQQALRVITLREGRGRDANPSRCRPLAET
ncbi:hypothetical protein F183_A25080 [Bryobacterales bacterium F-183]|nr:hypothetical protein F183_A25080 [Bryobacterales bacterium F-183]